MIALTASWALVLACTSFLLAADISFAYAKHIPEPSPQPSCDITNVCFAIDESNSITPTNFGIELNFVGLIATEIKTINPPAVLSAIAFSTSVQDVVEPTTDLASFIATVQAHPQERQGTIMGPALDSCRQKLEPLSGNRVIVFISDGMPGDMQDSIAAAATIRNEEDMYIVTVAIGDGGGDFLQNSIAHSPDFAVEGNFDTLPDEVPSVLNRICEVIDPTDDTYEPTDVNCGDALKGAQYY